MALFNIDTFYPRLECIDIGFEAQTRPIALLNGPEVDGLIPGVPDTAFGRFLTTVAVHVSILVIAVVVLLARHWLRGGFKRATKLNLY
jgi:hypothetical protein